MWPEILSLITSCSALKDITRLLGFMVPRGLEQESVVATKLVETCSLLRCVEYAVSIFCAVKKPEIYLCNTMMKLLSQEGTPQDAVLLYGRIHVWGVRPDSYSFPFVLKAVAQLSDMQLGREIHCQVIREGYDSKAHVATGLMQMYEACGHIVDARCLFVEMSHKDLFSWNVMLSGYAKRGEMGNARLVFDIMPVRNVVSWTALLSGYAQINRPHEAIGTFRMMQLANIQPDKIAMLSALSACANLGALELGEWIHKCINRLALFEFVPLCNALIDMYAKSGGIKKALEVFENMGSRSIVTWTTMIAGLALNGLGVDALQLFFRMERSNMTPNSVTFIAVLTACCHGGLIDMGHYFFNLMKSKYNITPHIEHYGCMVDLLGRCGFLNEALIFLRNMPFEPNAAIWGSLLYAAKAYGDLDLANCALRHLLQVEPENSGNYMLLSDVYAADDKWVDVASVRRVMKDLGVRKMPGGSSIEVNNTVHVFTSGDRLHPAHEAIYKVLHEVYSQSRKAGRRLPQLL